MRRLVSTLLTCLVLAGTGGRVAGEPVALVDALGRRVAIASPPRRVVPIFASNVELVAALGLADRIVGIEDYTRYPPEVLSRPRVGGRLGFSVDAVVAQNPDLIIVTPSRQAVHLLVDPMERLGVPVVVLLARSMAEVLDNLRLLSRALGVPDRGEAVASALASRLATVAAGQSTRPCPRAVMVTGRIGNGLLLVARPNTYTGDAMVRAGACFALAGSGPIPQVSAEALLAADPDVLIFAGSRQGLADLIDRPGFRDMRAVRDGRAITVERAQFLIPGPRTVDGIETLAHQLWEKP